MLGKVFWGHGGRGIGRSLEFTGIIHVSCVQTWQKLCHPRLRSFLPHIQSINKSCQLCFQNEPGIGESSLLSLIQTAIICHLVMRLASPLGFVLLTQTPATCSPQDHQSAKVRVRQASAQNLPVALTSLWSKPPLSPCPTGPPDLAPSSLSL